MKRALVLLGLPGCVLISDEELEWRQGKGASGDGEDCARVVLWSDADGDGYGDSQGALQVCEGDTPSGYVDNYDDCDDTDPTVNLYRDWYRDADEDGFGADGGDPVQACDRPDAYAAQTGDCDDTDAAVHPDAAEVCNGVDDDCDGDVDDDDADLDPGSAAVFYTDADGDGHGDPASEVVACSQPAGTALVADDCDDDDDEVSPDLEEVCNDFRDNDCDGSDNGCTPGGTLHLVSAGLGFTGAVEGDDLGAALSSGDLDGDGRSDLVLGAPRADTVGSSSGDVYIVAGPVTAGAAVAEAATAHVTAVAAGDLAGGTVQAGRDLDGDGYSDLLISAIWADEPANLAGSAFLLDGPLSGEVSLAGATRVDGLSALDRVGSDVDFAGDMDGDGSNDLLLGAFGEATGGGTAGAAYLILGPLSGSTDVGAASLKLVGQAGDRAGYAVAALGDTDGDGLDDLAVGADRADPEGDASGAVYVVGGPLTGTQVLADVGALRSGVVTREVLGTAVSSGGDLDGDGYADLLVGAPGWVDGGFTGAGAVYVLHGPITGSASAASSPVQLRGNDSGDAFGTSVSVAGDLNADGQVDLVVGAPGAESAWVFYGPHAGIRLAADGDLELRGEAGSATGIAVAAGGDLDGDDHDDVLIGAPGAAGGTAWIVTGGGL